VKRRSRLGSLPPANRGRPALLDAASGGIEETERRHRDWIVAPRALIEPVGRERVVLRHAAAARVAMSEQPERIQMALPGGERQPADDLLLHAIVRAEDRRMQTEVHPDSEAGVPVARESLPRRPPH